MNGSPRIHFKVGQQPEFFKRSALEQMRLVDDQEDGFPRLLAGFQEGGLDLSVDGAFGDSRRQPDQAVDVIEHIRPAERGQGGIERFEQILVETVHEAPKREGFADPRIAC
jgi:hypothetical protein